MCLLEDDEWAQKSSRWIAEQCGASPTTVGEIRADLTVHFGQPTTRTGQDGRTINTANIGKTSASDLPEPQDDDRQDHDEQLETDQPIPSPYPINQRPEYDCC